MPNTDAWIWIDSPVDEVVAVATDARRLGDWHALLATADERDRSDLGAVGSSIDATWRLGRTAPVRLTTTRRIRDVVYLDVTGRDGATGRLCVSMSPWDGGTAVELRADLDGWRVGRRALRRSLERSARDLRRLVTTARRTTVEPILQGRERAPLGLAGGTRAVAGG